MIFEPLWLTFLKRTLVITVIMAAYLWVSTDEWEFEQERQQQEQQLQTIPTEPEPVPEPELTPYTEPEQNIPGWIVPPEPVRKTVAKVKRKIKRTVKNGG